MTTNSWDRINDLFHEALQFEPGARTAFLGRACGQDADLLREVTEMIEAHRETGRLQVESRLLGDAGGGKGPLAGRRIGVYRLERLIGRGGMGDVYLAERCDDQYEHRVAFKLIREGLADERTSFRFRQERQILAQLNHPNIATLLDGGVTENGRPYLVMQYVDGVPITEYCVQRGLTLRQRLKLFRTVCQAVHVAHTNLVVHRDLKPGNILVTPQGEVKLLDFGIAKLLDTPEADITVQLDRILTPEHAAPEQVTGRSVTTATDVYALGVLLYELLAETRPFKIMGGSSAEIERMICETTPALPSTRLQGAAARLLRGELDNIVLMALRKEPERRYQSARELEDDIVSYLTDQPVRAQRDTLGYRTFKFIRRNRWAVAATGTILTLVTGFVITALVQSGQVAVERDRARFEQAKAESVVDVLAELLAGADPHTGVAGKAIGQEDFVAVIGNAVDEMSEQPEVQARLWELLAQVHRAHSRFDLARSYLDRAVGHHEAAIPDAIAVTRIRHALAQLTLQTEGPEAAMPLFLTSLERHRELFGDDHPDVGIAAQDLAGSLLLTDPDEAFRLLEQAKISAEAFPVRNPLAMASIHNRLGALLLNKGDYERARTSFEDALALMGVRLDAQHPNVLTVEHNLAASLSAGGRWQEAESIHRRILAVRQRNLGPQTIEVAQSLDSLAGVLASQGRGDEAMDGFIEAERIFRQRIGPSSPQVSNILRNMAVVEMNRDRPQEALDRLEEALAIDRSLGDEHNRSTVRKRGDRALALFTVGNRDEGLAEARVVLAAGDELATDPADSYQADLRTILATMLLAVGQASEAEKLAREGIAIRTARPTDTHPKLARDYCLLAATLVQQNRLNEAKQLLKKHHQRAEQWKLTHPLLEQMIADALLRTGISAG